MPLPLPNAVRHSMGVLTLAVAALLPAHSLAETITENVDEFSKVQFNLPHSVEFVVSDEHFVKLEGDEDTIDKIAISVNGDTLKLKRESSWFNWSDDGKVAITIGYDSLSAINMAGSGDGFAEIIESDDLDLKVAGSANLEVEDVQANDLELSISGSGNIQLHNIDVDEVTSRISGSGDIDISGRAVSQSASIAGSGDHDARTLKTQTTKASIIGSGDILVWVIAQLDASVTGSGDIEYYGDPDVEESVTGSGDINRLGDEP